jgi:hypothetical protein
MIADIHLCIYFFLCKHYMVRFFFYMSPHRIYIHISSLCLFSLLGKYNWANHFPILNQCKWLISFLLLYQKHYIFSLLDSFLMVTFQEVSLYFCFGHRGKFCFPAYHVSWVWMLGVLAGTFSPDVLGRGRARREQEGAQGFIRKWRKLTAQLIRKCHEPSPNFMAFLELMTASNQACLFSCRCVQPPSPYGFWLHWTSFFV